MIMMITVEGIVTNRMVKRVHMEKGFSKIVSLQSQIPPHALLIPFAVFWQHWLIPMQH